MWQPRWGEKYLGVEADFTLSDAVGDEGGDLLEVLGEVEGLHLGEDSLVGLGIGAQLGDELLDGLDLRRLGLALHSLHTAVEVHCPQRHPLGVPTAEGLQRDRRRLLLPLLHYYYHVNHHGSVP